MLKNSYQTWTHARNQTGDRVFLVRIVVFVQSITRSITADRKRTGSEGDAEKAHETSVTESDEQDFCFQVNRPNFIITIPSKTITWKKILILTHSTGDSPTLTLTSIGRSHQSSIERFFTWRTSAVLVSQNNETPAMFVSQTNSLGAELFLFVNAFLSFSTVVWLLATRVRTF